MVFNFLGDIVFIVVSVLIGINIGVLNVLCGVWILLRWVFVCLFVLISL